METGNSKDGASHDESKPSEAGEVEEAGETTAADTITGPKDTRPVGADTMIKVSGETEEKEHSTQSDPKKP